MPKKQTIQLKNGRGHEETFLQRPPPDGQRHTDRRSPSLGIGETRIQTTRHHLTRVRMAEINSTRNSKSWRACGEGERPALWAGMQTVPALTAEDSAEFPQKAKNRTTLWSRTHTTWVFTQKIKKHQFKGIHAPPCLLQYYLQFTMSNYGCNPNVHQKVNG